MNKRTRSGFLALVLQTSQLLAVDVYKISNETLLEDPQRFGANFELKTFSPWSELHHNCWNKFAACEPIVFRHNGAATDGGADFIEVRSGAPVSDKAFPTSPGSGYWSTMGNGFWDGAEIRIYRPTDTTIQLLRRSRVLHFNGLKDTDQRITLAETGEPVRRGDLFVMTMLRTEVPDALNPERIVHLGRQRYAQLPSPGSGVTWTLDAATHAPEGESTAAMKIVVPAGSSQPVGIEQPFLRFGGRELSFEPGATYRCELWLRLEGIFLWPSATSVLHGKRRCYVFLF